MERKISKYFEIYEKLRFCVPNSNQAHISIQIKLNRGIPKSFKHLDSNQTFHLILITQIWHTSVSFYSNQTLHLIWINHFFWHFSFGSILMDSNQILHFIRITNFLVWIIIYTWFESNVKWVKNLYAFIFHFTCPFD